MSCGPSAHLNHPRTLPLTQIILRRVYVHAGASEPGGAQAGPGEYRAFCRDP